MLVLRSDITKKLRSVKLLLVNLKSLSKNSGGYEYGEIWERPADRIKEAMDKLGVEILGYRTSARVSAKISEGLGIKNIIIKGDIKKELLNFNKDRYSFKDILLLGAEKSDLEIAGLTRFSVSTENSPLELKMQSDYVSNFNGIDAFQEIGNLIINAKGLY